MFTIWALLTGSVSLFLDLAAIGADNMENISLWIILFVISSGQYTLIGWAKLIDMPLFLVSGYWLYQESDWEVMFPMKIFLDKNKKKTFRFDVTHTEYYRRSWDGHQPWRIHCGFESTLRLNLMNFMQYESPKLRHPKN